MPGNGIQGPQGTSGPGPSLNLFPGPQIPETEGDNQGGGGDGAGECPIQVTHERLWKRKGMWTNCCCDHGHHELSTYSMPGIVLSVLPMFFMLALSQAFEVGFITPVCTWGCWVKKIMHTLPKVTWAAKPEHRSSSVDPWVHLSWSASAASESWEVTPAQCLVAMWSSWEL